MESNATMERVTAMGTRGCVREEKRATNVMVVYQDAHTRKWATNFYPSKVKGSDQVKCTWWNLNDFSEPGVLAGAVSTAIRADVIVVAVLTGRGLPLPFYVWVDSWLPHRKLTEGKLIALVGLAAERGVDGESGRAYLREMARKGNLNLIEKDCPAPTVQKETRTDRSLSIQSPRLACREDAERTWPSSPTLWLD